MNPDVGKEIAGPISAIAFRAKYGNISNINLWFCDKPDPNEFYGCSCPEIWKLSSAVTAGFFLIVFIIVWIYASERSPFFKMKEQNPRLQSGHEKVQETDWNDLERL